MSFYLILKTVHVISSTVLFGTGLGIAFFKWVVDRSGNVAAIHVVSRKVVLADWVFTSPAILTQAVSGIGLASLLGHPLTRGWVAYAIALYCFAGLCWIPVVWLQIQMQHLAAIAHKCDQPLGRQYWRYARIWFWLGIPAFTSLILVFWLMVTKPQ